MNLRSLLSRFRRFERRWIPPTPDRDAHEEVVRTRLRPSTSDGESADDQPGQPDEPQAASNESA